MCSPAEQQTWQLRWSDRQKPQLAAAQPCGRTGTKKKQKHDTKDENGSSRICEVAPPVETWKLLHVNPPSSQTTHIKESPPSACERGTFTGPDSASPRRRLLSFRAETLGLEVTAAFWGTRRGVRCDSGLADAAAALMDSVLRSGTSVCQQSLETLLQSGPGEGRGVDLDDVSAGDVGPPAESLQPLNELLRCGVQVLCREYFRIH